jgi:hypothetical protein
MLFSFLEVGFILPRASLDYVPREWVEESLVVCDDHLFILQIHRSSFETSWQEEMVLHREAFHRMSPSLILIYAISSA